jgi:HlyD family secretion protein
MAFKLGWNQPTTAVESALQGQPLSIMEFESPSAAVIAEPVSLGSRSAIWWISALLFCLLLIAAFVPTDIVVTATGITTSTANPVVMQPYDSSIIKSIDVHVGQIVTKGQLLATMDPTLTAADVQAYKKAVAELTPEIQRLQDEKDHKAYVPTNPNDPNQLLQLKEFQQENALHVATDANYDQQIAGLEQQISGNLEQAAYYKERLGMASDIETLRKQEESMYVGSKLETLEASDTRVADEAAMQQNIAQAQAEKAQLQSTEAQKASADATAATTIMDQISQVQPQLDAAIQNLQKADLHSGLVEMRAPMDGVVLQIEKLNIGSVIQPGEQFIQVVPLDKPLAIDAYVSGTDIGWVQPGDYAQIKFDTFMYTEYGDARGHVVNTTLGSFVSPTAPGTTSPLIPSTTTGDASNTMPVANTMSPNVSVYYTSRIVIDRMALRHVPKDFRLVPGMPLTVDIKAGWRTYLEYCFSRVAPVFNEAMREP